MLQHRPVTEYDIDIICAFAQTPQELFYFYPRAQWPLTMTQLLSAINQRRYSTILEKDGVVAGFANFYQWQTQGVCKIGNFIINPAFRRQGLARHLLNIMLDKAAKNFSAQAVQITCFSENEIALHTYRQYGFVPVETGSYQTPSGEQKKLLTLHFLLD